ncbi:photosystem I reaction center protein subunit XI [Lyngbya aestuarii]|uniref:photosystem I reaction center protein subunit XI n=1 Tax=Lyngbya aestuarii TaxID=118322 RepID=UPI00403E1F30
MADPRNKELVQAYNGDPFVGHLSTPISDSSLVNTYLNNLPIYRKGISPLLRGLEIGMAHGYFLIGPWTLLGPLRDYPDAANLGALISVISLIVIATGALAAYGIVSFQEGSNDAKEQNPRTPEAMTTDDGWSQFTGGFFVGAMGGAFVAYFLLENFDIVDAIFRGVVNNT